ncbi:hypothetical protein S7711_02352 [Stachybotrys chartarum IBT 7711]|uniref:Lysophospholipase n=1 Tax=Stachybotrys chartarum (strain CBS 109288 / IBT 7711) TaxID=1280523 RepID=A0A084B116_STACB|nr:hypothetical protein S7711_02352 [Stachybotrys chartarum IBT 7711]
MKIELPHCLIGSIFILLGQAHAVPGKDLAPLSLRALPNSPSGGYAPDVVDCPTSRPQLRLADGLSSSEAEWLAQRRNNTVDPMRRLLSRANISDFDAEAYIDNARDNLTTLPNIGIAVSGGGYRALMNGAGFISAADSRNSENGSISGLLQSTTYLAGLSGGGWLVGSIFANNFSTVPDLQRGNNDTALWRFDRTIFTGPEESGIGVLNTVSYWQDISNAVDSKAEGWETSLTDYWGRALSYQLIGTPDGGPAYTFSSIAESDHFQSADTPYPILVSDGRRPGERIISLNATVYEFNPFELGTWDPTVYGFAPLRYIASNFTNGSISSNGSCVRGFDQFGYVMGTSSSLFNQFLLANITSATSDSGIPSFIVDALQGVLERLDEDENDVAQYVPNPFFGWNPTSDNANSDKDQLSLVDGGEDLQNIPLHPLIQPYRAVDIIFAIDSSADTSNNWPNGTALRASYDRSMNDMANGTLFPAVPSAETFINQRLNQRPTLFGCDADNFTLSGNETVPPLIFYIPNAPYTTHSNVSTFDPSYSTDERNAIILNGLNAATQGNGTVDDQWPTCVACAILSRSWWRSGESVPDDCARCFDRYCWNGTTDDSPIENYDPEYILQEEFNADSGDDDSAGSVIPASATLGAVISLVVMSWISL